MNSRARLLALSLVLSCSYAAPSTATPTCLVQAESARAAVVLRVGERPFTWNQYGAWLTRVAGPRYTDAVVQEHLVLEALAAAGLDVTTEAARAQVERQVTQRIDTAFGGDRALWIDELERTGSSESDFYGERTAEALGELRVEQLVRSRRSTDEAGLRSAWEALYGPSGRQPELRGLFLEIGEVKFPEGVDEQGKDILRTAKRKQMQRKAAEHLRRARSGEDFGALIREHSQDTPSRELDGYLPEPYTISDWPEELADALREAEAGSYIGPFLVGRGFWVFQVESVVETEFASVEDAIRDHLENAPPSSAETRALFADLLAGRTPRILPELWVDPGAGLERMNRPVVALGDLAITRHEMAVWLTARRGHAEAQLFAQMQLVEALAEERELDVPELVVQQRIESDLAARIDTEFEGDKQAWLAQLARTGQTEESYRRGLEPRTRHGLLVEQMLLDEREVTDADVRALWEDRYGPGGESPRIRSIVRRPVPLPDGIKPTEEQLAKYLADQELEITTLLGELIVRLGDGEDFATLAKRYSQDPATKDRGGLNEHRFRYDVWPADVRQTLESLAVGEVSPIIELGLEYYIFENSGTTSVPFEEVAESLRKELTERRPSTIEVSRYISALARGVEVKIEPALIEPYLSAGSAPQ